VRRRILGDIQVSANEEKAFIVRTIQWSEGRKVFYSEEGRKGYAWELFLNEVDGGVNGISNQYGGEKKNPLIPVFWGRFSRILSSKTNEDGGGGD